MAATENLLSKTLNLFRLRFVTKKKKKKKNKKKRKRKNFWQFFSLLEVVLKDATGCNFVKTCT